MSADLDLENWLSRVGYGAPQARTLARSTLESVGLTVPGKQRISEEKLSRAEAALREVVFLHCPDPGCAAAAQGSGKEAFLTDRRERCAHCRGSDNQRAVHQFVAAAKKAGVSQVVIVGGSPSTREELERTLARELSVRLVDGTERRPIERAKADLEWGHLVLLWGASELHHKVSRQYADASPEQRRRQVHVPRRGISQLLHAGMEHLARPRRAA
jgi:hypothetical protein